LRMATAYATEQPRTLGTTTESSMDWKLYAGLPPSTDVFHHPAYGATHDQSVV
jgi:hypothetical protein